MKRIDLTAALEAIAGPVPMERPKRRPKPSPPPYRVTFREYGAAPHSAVKFSADRYGGGSYSTVVRPETIEKTPHGPVRVIMRDGVRLAEPEIVPAV